MPFSREFIRNHKVELIALMALCIAYGFHGTVFNAIPYMFFRPDIMCKASTDDAQEYLCSEEVMCNIINGNNPDNLTYRIHSYNNIMSIVTEYNLYCELQYYEALIQTVLTLGQLGGFLLSFIWSIPSSQKYKVILVTLYIESSILLMLNFFDSLSVAVFVLFAQNFLFSYFYAIIFVFFADYFNKEINEIAPIITNFLWASTMIIYVCCAYYMTNWRNHLSKFSAIPILLLTIVFQYCMRKVEPAYLTHPHLHPPIQAETTSVIQDLKKRIFEIKNDTQQRNNLLAFIVCNICASVSFFGVFIALNRLEGNLYVNNSVSILFELQGGIAAAILISRFQMKKILIGIFSVMSFAYLSCFFFQSFGSSDSKSVLSLVVSLSPIFAAKAAHEMLFPIFVLYLPKIIKKQNHQFAFAIANIIAVIMINFLPFYQYTMEQLGLNQFVGYGLFMISAVVYMKKVVEFEQPEEVKKHSRKPSSYRASIPASFHSNSDDLSDGIELPLINPSHFHH